MNLQQEECRVFRYLLARHRHGLRPQLAEPWAIHMHMNSFWCALNRLLSKGWCVVDKENGFIRPMRLEMVCRGEVT